MLWNIISTAKMYVLYTVNIWLYYYEMNLLLPCCRNIHIIFTMIVGWVSCEHTWERMYIHEDTFASFWITFISTATIKKLKKRVQATRTLPGSLQQNFVCTPKIMYNWLYAQNNVQYKIQHLESLQNLNAVLRMQVLLNPKISATVSENAI